MTAHECERLLDELFVAAQAKADAEGRTQFFVKSDLCEIVVTRTLCDGDVVIKRFEPKVANPLLHPCS